MHYYDDELSIYGLVRHLFVASACACFLWAFHRLARGVLLGSRIKAYGKLEEAYTPEEREELIHRIKTDSLRF